MESTSPVTIKISKILLASVGLSLLLTGATGIALALTFKPYRYTGKADEIYRELQPSPQSMDLPQEEGTPITDSAHRAWAEYDKMHPEVAEGRERRMKLLGVTPSSSKETTPVYRDRKAWERTTGKPLIFGGTEEFFKYCGDGDGVSWTPMDIEGSIQSRQQYLISKIEHILLVIFPVSLILSYLILYGRKKRIRILIN